MKIIYESEKTSVVSTLKNNSIIPKEFKNLPFEKIKNAILGKKYELSIVLVGAARIKNLNLKYRNKNKPTNVLSFEIDKNEGEIFICPKVSQIDLLFLLIHAMLHLKGLVHSSRMERYEQRYYNRYRYRHL